MSELQDDLLTSENWLSVLKKIEYKKLTKDQQLIYDIIYEILSHNMESSELQEYTEYLGPTSGVQAQIPVLLAEYYFDSVEDVSTYLKVLSLVPDYFDEILAFEQKKSKDGLFMTDTSAQAVIDQCQNFIQDPDNNYLISVFNNKIKNVPGLTKEQNDTWKEENRQQVQKSIIPAYKKLAAGLQVLKGTSKTQGGLSNLPKGKQYYSWLVKCKTGSNRSLDEIDEMLTSSLEGAQSRLSQIMTDHPKDYYSAQKVSYKYKEPKAAVNYLKNAVKKDFPPLSHKIKCNIKYVDESMEESASPAFYLTSPIDGYEDNVVYINQSSAYDLSRAFTTVAHESYPGHLYQNCYYQSLHPDPVRSVINVGGYTEGWGTYAELYGYHLAGLKKNVASILEQNTLATLCVYAKADLVVNYKGWNFKKLKNYLSEYGFDETQSRTIYDSMVAEPAGYMQYTLGYLEIEDMLNQAKEKLGPKFQIKKFHEFYLSMGPAPFDIIRERLQKWIREQM